jgi:hypothetical protein
MDTNAKKFEITLIGHYWDLIPEYAIYCDQKLICRKEIDTATEIPHTEVFTYSSKKLPVIRIDFENKMTDQSVLNLDRTRLIRDMSLEVKKIAIDGEEIDFIKHCVYTLDQKYMFNGVLTKQIVYTELNKFIDLGFNGSLRIDFDTVNTP